MNIGQLATCKLRPFYGFKRLGRDWVAGATLYGREIDYRGRTVVKITYGIPQTVEWCADNATPENYRGRVKIAAELERHNTEMLAHYARVMVEVLAN